MTAPYLRHPQPGDVQAVLDLMLRGDLAESGEADSDLEDLTHDWSQMDLSRDAWIAGNPEGPVVGYGAVGPWGSGLHLDIRTEPEGDAEALLGELFSRCRARAAELAAERPEGRLTLTSYLTPSQAALRHLLEASGFVPARHHFQMRLSLDAPPREAAWPAGVSPRQARIPQDEVAIHGLIQRAFDRPDRQPVSLEDWRTAMLRPEIYVPELWTLAVARDAGLERIVGACLAFQYPDEGWVRQLAVEESWRGSGIASALLQSAFQAFRAMGLARAGLTVAGPNLGARALYEKVGMRAVHQYDEYEGTVTGSNP